LNTFFPTKSQLRDWFDKTKQHTLFQSRGHWRTQWPEQLHHLIVLFVDLFVCEAATPLSSKKLRTHTSGAQYWDDREAPSTNRTTLPQDCARHMEQIMFVTSDLKNLFLKVNLKLKGFLNIRKITCANQTRICHECALMMLIHGFI